MQARCAAVFAIALAVRAFAAALVRSPGYIDAYYYFHVATRLAAGHGMTETVVWNYLTPPLSLPRPAGAYWPPGTALLAAAGLAIFPWSPAREPLAWRAAQCVPVLLSAAVAAGAYAAARRLAPGRGDERRAATVAGLAILSGVYFPYWVTTDTFTPFALAGGAVLWLSAEAARGSRRGRALAALAAFLAGIAQFVRPDGVLLLLAPIVALTCRQRNSASAEGDGFAPDASARSSPVARGLVPRRPRPAIGGQAPALRPRTLAGGRQVSALRPHGPSTTWKWPPAMVVETAAIATAFIAGLVPWLAQNWLTWRALMPPGAGAAVWLSEYDDLFAYAAPPSFERWRAAGLDAALSARAGALIANMGVLGQPLLFYLVPFALFGAWRLRRQRTFWPALAYLAALYLAMSLVFPFQGVRGGFFHSLAAALPFLAIWTVQGVEAAVAAAARRRRWLEPQAQRVFAAALLAFSAMSSVYFLVLQAGRWDARLDTYREVALLLDAHVPVAGRVLAVDPPGLWYASGRESIVIPGDGFDALLSAAGQFDAGYLVVEANGPAYLAPLWRGSEPVAGFTCLGTTDQAALYAVNPSRAGPATVCPPGPGRRARPD